MTLNIARGLLAGGLVFALLKQPVQASTYTWNGGGGSSSIVDGGGTWSTGGGTWYNGSGNYNTPWSNGNAAAFGSGASGSGAAGTVTISGSVATLGLTFNAANGGGNYTLSGASGTVSVKGGVSGGTLADNATGVTTINSNLALGISGSQAMSVVSGGTLQIAGAVSGGTGSGGISQPQNYYSLYGSGVLQFLNTTGTLTTGNISVYGGTVDFNGANLTIPNDTLRWQNSTVGSTTQMIIENGANLQVSSASINGNSKMGQTALSSGTAAQILTISGGTLNYASAFITTTLQVGAANDCVGTVNENSGLLSFTVAGSADGVKLGASAGAAGAYYLNGGTLLTPSVLPQAAGGTGIFNLNGGTLEPNFSNSTFMSGLTAANVQNGGAFINTNGYNITIAQSLLGSGSGGLTVSGSGMLTLTGANTYIGGTTVSAGTLALGSLGAIGGSSAGPVTVNGGVLNLAGYTPAASSSLSLSLAGGSVVNSGAAAAFPGTSYSVQSGSISAVLAGGAVQLTKSTAGTVVLSAAMTYSDSTNVNAGALLLNAGTLNAASPVYVAAGATFGGNGSAGSVAVAGGGNIQSGYSGAGNLSLAALNFSGSGGVSFSSVGISDSTSPAILVSGINALNPGSGAITITVGSLTGTPTGTYELIGYNGAIGGSGSAAFQLAALPNRATGTLTSSGNVIELNYIGTDFLHWSGAASAAWDSITVN